MSLLIPRVVNASPAAVLQIGHHRPRGPPFMRVRPRVPSCTNLPIVDVGSNSLHLALYYNSDNADGSRGYIDIGLGYGWIHSHSSLLFSQRGHMFLLDGNGQVTRFRRSGRTTYSAGDGYFQTLERNLDSSFTLIDKDETTHRFESIPGDTLRIAGRVLRIRRVAARNDRVTEYDYDGTGRLTEVRDTTFGYGATFTYLTNGNVEIADTRTGRTTAPRIRRHGPQVAQGYGAACRGSALPRSLRPSLTTSDIS